MSAETTTKMRRAVVFVFMAGALLAVWVYWQMKKPRPIDMPVGKDEIVQVPRVETPQIVSTHGEGVPPKLARKKHWQRPLSYYPQKKMALAKSHLWVLQGLTASLKKREGDKEIARINQYYVYKTPSAELQNIVYDDEKRQYGVLTMEFTVVVLEGVLPGLAQKYGLEILKEGALGAESILRSDSGTFFTRDLPYFVKEEGVIAIRPYVSYGLAKFR